MKDKLLTTENILALIFWVICLVYPLTHSAYRISNFTYYYIMIIFVLSLYILWGFTGIFSFGQAAYFGVGAYVYGIISKSNPEVAALSMVGILTAIIVCFLMAAILGFFIYYGNIDGSFIGIITYCLSLLLQTFMTQTSGPEWKVLGVQLGGFNGMNKIPPIRVFGMEIEGIPMFYVCLFLALGLYLAFRYIQKSKIGYTLFGIRENSQRSKLFGYNTALISTLVFATGGAIAGFAGVLFSSWSAYVVPSTLSVSTSFIGVIVIALSGRYSVTGATLMTFVYVWFTRTLSSSGNVWSQIIQGAVLVIIILFLPKGIGEFIFKTGDRFLEKVKGLFIGKKTKVELSEDGDI